MPSAAAADLLGSADDVVYRLACETERVLITLNYQDFRLMEKFPPEQCGGILAVRMGSLPSAPRATCIPKPPMRG